MASTAHENHRAEGLKTDNRGDKSGNRQPLPEHG